MDDDEWIEALINRLICASPCMLCGECLMKKNLPCPHPEERHSCVSAYCIDVMALAKACGMAISWELDQVSYFSLFLFKKKMYVSKK